MRLRIALLVTSVIAGLMFALQWWVRARLEWAVNSGWELPRWFRFLANVTAFWRAYWFIGIVLILGTVLVIGDLFEDAADRRKAPK